MIRYELMKQMYAKGVVITGVITVPLMIYKDYSDSFIQPIPAKTFREFTSIQSGLNRDVTCAEKVVFKSCRALVYPFRKTVEYETGCKLLSGTIGAVQGVSLAFTWPILLPLVGFHMAEQKLGWKLC